MRPAWVTRGIAQLVRQFCNQRGNAAWIGIASLDGFWGQPRNGLFRAGGRCEAMPDLPIADGFVWQPDAGPDEPEFWLSPTRTGYRPLFERFAQRYLGAAGLDGAAVQIDHVFPKAAAALGGLAYVRMLAIPPDSNMAAGRTLERAMAERNRSLGPRRKRTRLATYFAIGKATGFAAYQQLPDDGQTPANAALARALLAHLAAFGLPAGVLTGFDQQLTADTAARQR